MNCELCKGAMEERYVTHEVAPLIGNSFKVCAIPANVCSQCGCVWLSSDVTIQLTKIADKLSMTPIANLVAVKYSGDLDGVEVCARFSDT